MTGLTETEHIVRGLEAGGVDYVTKPIVVAEMLARIKVHLTNARLTRSARAALDASGRYLFAVNPRGAVVWSTPLAHKILIENFSTGDDINSPLPAPWISWLGEFTKGSTIKNNASPPLTVHGAHRLQYLGTFRENEHLLHFTTDSSTEPSVDIGKVLGLTRREAEVLSWLSKGKANRDIAEILGLSPRTVDKHLEQIYAKLGVENRTAAVAIAANARQKHG